MWFHFLPAAHRQLRLHLFLPTGRRVAPLARRRLLLFGYPHPLHGVDLGGFQSRHLLFELRNSQRAGLRLTGL